MNEQYSDDIASALEESLGIEPVNMPRLRILILQAIVELRALKQATAIKANPVLEALNGPSLTSSEPHVRGAYRPIGEWWERR